MMENVLIEVSSGTYERLIAFERNMRKKDKGMAEQDSNFIINYLIRRAGDV